MNFSDLSVLRVLRCSLAGLTALALVLPAAASPKESEAVLTKKDAQKQEVRHSMIGFRDTLLFYTFAKQKAVLRLQVQNKDATFPVSGSVFLFAPDTAEEGLKKWVNNQHSDARFIDAAKPAEEIKLPAGICAVIEKKLIDGAKKDRQGNPFYDYQIKLSVKDHEAKGKFRIKAFQDDAKVYLKVTNS